MSAWFENVGAKRSHEKTFEGSLFAETNNHNVVCHGSSHTRARSLCPQKSVSFVKHDDGHSHLQIECGDLDDVDHLGKQ